MKRVLSKILIALALIILLFEFSMSNSLISYAYDPTQLPISEDAVKNIEGFSNGFIAFVLWVPKFIATSIAALANTALGIIAEMENTDSPGAITPFKIFFNKYDVLSVNMFDFGSDPNSFNYKFRSTIAIWYYMMRILASAVLLVVLIYVGIRMAISSVAEDKAKYKKMLLDWVMRNSINICYALHSNFRCIL